MTYPGGQPDPQQPHGGQPYQPQPYEQPYQQSYEQPPVSGVPSYGPPVSGQPYGQPVSGQPYSAQPYGPPGGSTQRGGKWALLGLGSFLALVLVIVGAYFTYQRVFVHTPSEVVQAYLDEATKENPDAHEMEKYLCKDEASKLEKELATSKDSSGRSGRSSVLEWHVTGESVNGSTATVFTQFTVKDSNSRTANHTLNLTLVKESREWKICGFEV
ncbi:hypothetical protein AB0M46_50650 [Dactylosporangium sp. NPDC051485]|uniref:Rv0361 family membrane protein n=1 Tax=Dactylosporangium sp. NPDC051485 TaxID=3154846 RepID=UPI00341B1915